MNEPEMAANWNVTLRHWSTDLRRGAASETGRVGTPLCGRMREVWDQEAIDHLYRYGRKRRVIAELPPCKRCEQLHWLLVMQRGGGQ